MSALGVRALLEDWVRIPRRFYDDHAERELPTPVEQHGTKRWVWIRKDDPAMGELINDAQHYARDVDGAPWLIPSAKALLAALEHARVPIPKYVVTMPPGFRA